MRLIVRDQASHDQEHGECLPDGSDEVQLAPASSIDERERNAGGKGVNSREDGAEDEGKLATETEVLFKDGGTVEAPRMSVVAQHECRLVRT